LQVFKSIDQLKAAVKVAAFSYYAENHWLQAFEYKALLNIKLFRCMQPVQQTLVCLRTVLLQMRYSYMYPKSTSHLLGLHQFKVHVGLGCQSSTRLTCPY
jgi:hypothetical protein